MAFADQNAFTDVFRSVWSVVSPVFLSQQRPTSKMPISIEDAVSSKAFLEVRVGLRDTS